MAKWVYMFTEGNATMRNLLGGKGANLAEMTSQMCIRDRLYYIIKYSKRSAVNKNSRRNI